MSKLLAWTPWLLAGAELIAILWILASWRATDAHLTAQLAAFQHPATTAHHATTTAHSHAVTTAADGTVTDTETDLVSDGEDSTSSPVVPTVPPAELSSPSWGWGPRVGLGWLRSGPYADFGVALGIGRGWRIAPSVGAAWQSSKLYPLVRVGIER
jgi:polyisoprenoid-binding protein YceI